MNKSQLIIALAKDAGTTKNDAANFLAVFVKVIGKELARNGQVDITGFGKFKVSKRSARTGRNPQTGAVIQIKASKVPAFKAGKGLKEVVQKGK